MTAIQYARFYSIPQELIPVMEQVSKGDYHFFRRKIDNGFCDIKTGWYSGSGAFTKRQSIADKIIKASHKVGYPAYKFYDGKPSAKTERVKIILIPHSIFNN
jgi:hypothetical protein